MNTHTILSKRNFIGKFLKKTDIVLRENCIIFDDKSFNLADIYFLIKHSKKFLGYVLELNSGEQVFQVKYLQDDAITFAEKANKKIASNIIDLTKKQLAIFHTYCIEQYPRRSRQSSIKNAIRILHDVSKQSQSEIEKSLGENVWQQIVFATNFHKKTFEEIQASHEDIQFEKRKIFFNYVESNPLTQEQRLAVLRTDDINLVLAAAGTGKTSVMVAKALDLIDRKLAEPSEILILAYNKSAAEELKERLIEKAEKANIELNESPKISTFHALGKGVLQEAGISTRLSIFAEDDLKLENWVTTWLKEYLFENILNILDIALYFCHEMNPFAFKSKSDYESFTRDNDFRTLQGEKVRGYQELLIANFLFANNVKYEYEPRYISKKRIEIGFDYRPDFKIKDLNTYIEHFGIDRKGNTRPDIDSVKYVKDMDRKRALHHEHGTILVESYHYEWVEGTLLSNLQKKLEDQGVQFEGKTANELLKDITSNKEAIPKWAKTLKKALLAIRIEQLDKDAIYERLKKANMPIKGIGISNLLDNLHKSYVKKLQEDNSIDFDDMIIRATDTIQNSRYSPKWKFILIDEFQDISMARMNFINKLIDKGPSPSLTVVGDDWQAIYRFSGGKLELTTRFEELVGIHSLTKLQKTFRYNNSIAETAGMFVMENPEQYKKSIQTHAQVTDSQIFLYDDSGPSEDGLNKRILEIVKCLKKEHLTESIAIIARYNYLLRSTRIFLKENKVDKNINFWSFHKSKGLEADNCILIGFFQGKVGFPNQNKDDAIVEALLPLVDGFEHSEERRLLYVGITRAKNRCYIIASATAPSTFINELLAPKYTINIESRSFSERNREIYKCPHCVHGYLRLITGQYGSFYSCSSGFGCSVGKARVCNKCQAPSVDYKTESKCNNPVCKTSFKICPICGRPLKQRSGKYGNFWGCSGYGIPNDQCKYTCNN